MAGVSRRTEVIVNVVVCVGAAIVIFGAWAKLLHMPFADLFLTIGLMTEAFIFLVYAFIPPPYSNPAPVAAAIDTGGNPALRSLDKMLQEADITPANLQKLSAGFNRLGTTVEKMGEVSDVVKTTGDFSNSARAASEAMNNIKSTMDKTVSSMDNFNQASESTRNFHMQLQNLNKNLGSLNALYEVELNDSNNHLKAMNKYFGNLTAMSEVMQSSVEDARSAQTEIGKLSNNLSRLNNVYGNMLNAMQGRA